MNGVSEGSGRQIWSYQGRVRDYVRTTNWKIAFDVCDLGSAAARNHLQQSRLEPQILEAGERRKTNFYLPRLIFFFPSICSLGFSRCACLPPGRRARWAPSHKQAERCHAALVKAPVWPFQSHSSHSGC